MAAMTPSKICEYCKKKTEINQVKLMVCSKCKFTSYCDRHCQAKDWKKHKSICNNLILSPKVCEVLNQSESLNRSESLASVEQFFFRLEICKKEKFHHI